MATAEDSGCNGHVISHLPGREGRGSAPTWAYYTFTKKFVSCISNQLSVFVTKLKTFQQIEIIAEAYWAIKITQFRKVQIWLKKIVIFYPLWRRPGRPFRWIGLLQPTTTWHKIRNAAGQAHHSRTGTSKQRQVKLHWFRSLCFNVPVRE